MKETITSIGFKLLNSSILLIVLSFVQVFAQAQNNSFLVNEIKSDDLKSNLYKENDWRIGIFGALDINQHFADFKKIPDCPNCSPGFEYGSGLGTSFGLLYEIPYSEKIKLSVKISYFGYSGLLSKIEPTYILPNGKSVNTEITHTLDAGLASLGIEPEFKYELFNKFYLNLAFHLGYVINKTYDQQEEITNSNGFGTFYDSLGNDTHDRFRNKLSGDISKNMKLNFSPGIGISYELPLNNFNTLTAEPFVSFNYNLLNVINSDDVKKWSVSSLRLGMAIKYNPVLGKEKSPPEIEEKSRKIIKIDTIIVENISNELFNKITYTIDMNLDTAGFSFDRFNLGQEYIDFTTETEDNVIYNTQIITRTDTIIVKKNQKLLDCSITAVGVDSNGIEIPNPILHIEEFVSNKLQPLLNYVFFTEGSDIIQDKYVRIDNVDDFTENSLFNDSTLGIYYQILNIIGFRMRNNPKAILTITGCNDAYSSEKNDIELSNRRAETVRNYFLSVWKLDKSRLKIESRNLPEQASSPINQIEKIEENRRVELTSNIYEIIKPVFLCDTLRKADPGILRFKPKINSEAGIDNWTVSTRQFYNNLQNFYGEVETRICDWNLNNEQKSMPKYEIPLIYRLSVIDNEGKQDSTLEKFINVELISISKKRGNRIGDLEYDKYSLILFDFNSSEIEKANKSILDFIRPRIKDGSEIEITGYTDRTGDDDYNKNLSAQRASSTKQLLGKNDAKFLGKGEEILLYNNNFPEGRFYCRTVNIEITTPVK